MVRWLRGRWAAALSIVLSAPSIAIPPYVPPRTERIVAVGDLHGDFAVWRAIARAARVTDADGHWAGGQTVLVQLGDITDRGPASLKIIRNLQQLQREAPRTHGRVVVLIGNHEAMQMTGDLRYLDPGELAAFVDDRSARRREAAFANNLPAIAADYRARDPKIADAAIRLRWLAVTPLGKVEHDLAWAPSGELGRWTLANPAAALIGSTLFVHGGISHAYAAVPLAEINRRVHAALEARDSSETAIINDQAGPLWYRGYSQRPPAGQIDPAAAELSEVLAATGAKRVVIAHTPKLSGIVIDFGGRLAQIDTGNSAYYNGTPSYLEIIGDKMIAHAVPRPTGDRR